MAVHTKVAFADAATLVAGYRLGTLNVLTGIDQGIENTNYRLDTSGGPVLLTLFERRTNGDDLPWLIALHDHLASRGIAVPPVLRADDGAALSTIAGKPAALFGWLEGAAIDDPTLGQCAGAGEALGRMHRALAAFALARRNPQGRDAWHDLAGRYGERLDELQPGLKAIVDTALARIEAEWPAELPHATIHADLFPDNVMAVGDSITGLIDFAFACHEVRAYDLAVTHAAWCFDADGTCLLADRSAALVDGYERAHGLLPEERAALPLLGMAASLRFLLTRAEDWFAWRDDIGVTRKDPLAFARRLRFYAAASSEDLMGPTPQ
ncbi:homoserine kinase [Sphingorhabdus soli]|uniref:Homoserine kinase n=1 Tax=Flavisphingopyxis soli TaxID=2601267 RepID=A0A5C6U8I5_9SPHN|nr:homoserine kinase [Sphingorhabdus soli]TXC68710.1 homoserine kinase [Sphingorhabdus soli]